MKTRFHKNAKVADIMVTAIGGTLSVGVTLYGVYYFGLSETWPELVLNVFYVACFAMIWMYFFNIYGQFNNIRYNHDDTKGYLNDWFVNTSIGIRL